MALDYYKMVGIQGSPGKPKIDKILQVIPRRFSTKFGRLTGLNRKIRENLRLKM